MPIRQTGVDWVFLIKPIKNFRWLDLIIELFCHTLKSKGAAVFTALCTRTRSMTSIIPNEPQLRVYLLRLLQTIIAFL